MYTIYRINADELNADFVESLKTLFRHKHIEITVHESDLAETAELQERRRLLVTETQESLALFQRGGLPAQTSSEVIDALRVSLAES